MSEQPLSTSTERYVPMPRDERDHPEWRAPLRLLERALRALPPAEGDDLFAPDDFSIVGRLESAAHPPLVLYKHVRLWNHLNVDPSGVPYRFLAPRRTASFGTYEPYESLRAAIDDLELAELGRLPGGRGHGGRSLALPGPAAA